MPVCLQANIDVSVFVSVVCICLNGIMHQWMPLYVFILCMSFYTYMYLAGWCVQEDSEALEQEVDSLPATVVHACVCLCACVD